MKMIKLNQKAAAALGAVAITLSLAAMPAQAKPKFYPKGYGYHHHHKYGYGAPLAAGIVGAIALGAVAASAASEPSCYIEERERFDRFGNLYVRQVRVCD
jgi:hypothetical protein